MDIIGSIRAAIAANIRAAITTEEVYDYLQGEPQAPYLWIYPDEVAFDESGGTDVRRFIVEAIADVPFEENAQRALDAYMGNGDTSVKKAIEADRTLGGLLTDLQVVTCSGYRFFTRAGVDYIGCQWTVEISVPNEDA